MLNLLEDPRLFIGCDAGTQILDTALLPCLIPGIEFDHLEVSNRGYCLLYSRSQLYTASTE